MHKCMQLLALLRKAVAHLVAIHCICHRGHLGAQDAFKDVPWAANLDELVKALSNYYAHSCERRAELRKLQGLNEDPVIAVLRMGETRWLSRGNSVDSI